jgi:class 3 adenylate cyclase
MSGHTKTPVALEIAHVLFIDIVGYSKLPTTEQHAAVGKLNELVQNTEPFQAAEKVDRLLRIPAGDGMALVFYTTPEEPVRCAIAISRALKMFPNLQVRMGVHSGSVSGVIDVDGRANVAGAGMNIAQRVMDCGDGGHILLSKHAADDLAEYENWRPLLHDLGSCEVKHGFTIQVESLWSDEVGNPRTPSKLRAQRERSRRRKWMWLGGATPAAIHCET